MYHHLMASSIQKAHAKRIADALRRVEGAFSIVAMTRTKLIGVRDPLGVRPLVLGRIGDKGYVLSSETCGLDIIGAKFVREIEPGEMVVIQDGVIETSRPFGPSKGRFCIFEHVYFSRPDSLIGGRSVYETRHQIGVELAREAPRRGRSRLPPCPIQARLRRSVSVRNRAFPSPSASPATNIWAEPLLSRQITFATWACASS